jgi:cell wall-associated NlpC family hydrolase
MSVLARMQISVAVGSVWTSPESPRALDEAALRNPADIDGWLGGLTVPDKLNLSDDNRLQTQALFGTEVLVTEEKGDWAHICIPDQTTSKNGLGYPGWIPRRQLAELQVGTAGAERAEAEITAKRATLTVGRTKLTLGYLTRLRVTEVTADSIGVDTPLGAGVLDRNEARIKSFTNDDPVPAHEGRSIAEQAARFDGLPYLWGGLSSFGFDCSGFAYMMHRSRGIPIPRDASDQALAGETIVRERLEPGDLLFFAAEEGEGRIHHVGIYAGDNRMIHSPDSGSVVTTVRLDEGKLANEFCLAKRYWGRGAAYAG